MHEAGSSRHRRAKAGTLVIGGARRLRNVVSAISAGRQFWPGKPIRLLLPYPPGAGSDVIARLLAQKLADHVGQQVIVDNRGGAGGNIGMELAAKTPAPIIARLNSELIRVLNAPDVRDRIRPEAVEPIGSTPEFFAGYIRSELAKWAQVVKGSGAKID